MQLLASVDPPMLLVQLFFYCYCLPFSQTSAYGIIILMIITSQPYIASLPSALRLKFSQWILVTFGQSDYAWYGIMCSIVLPNMKPPNLALLSL